MLRHSLPIQLAPLISEFIQAPPPQIPPAQLTPPKKKFGLFKLLLLLGAGFIGLIVLVGIFAGGGESTRASGKPIDPEATLKTAEANVLTSLNGVAYSNSEQGLALATLFSSVMKESSMTATDSLKDRHDFVTHCQLHPDSVAFIVHVPKLRKSDRESKERFCEAAWEVSNHVLSSDPSVAVGTELAVAVKGNLLYQNMYFGTYTPPVGEEVTAEVTLKSKDEEKLAGFFKATPTPAAPVTP